jgi:hypothetical protein
MVITDKENIIGFSLNENKSIIKNIQRLKIFEIKL